MSANTPNPVPIKEWIINNSNSKPSEYSDYPRLIESILSVREINSDEERASYLSPQLKSLSDPFLIPQMDKAVERILKAIDLKEKIVIYGDYDVDGVTSLTLMKKVLTAFNNDAVTFLPHRIDDGYGLSIDALKRCIDDHSPSLIIAVDCGTTSIEEIDWLNKSGVESVILDHHEALSSGLPNCTAIVNPKATRSLGGNNFEYFCSVGIVFKLSHALLKTRPIDDFDLREYLDIVALGTVADLVPLIKENRILVKKGLAVMANTKNVGLAALTEIAGIRPPYSAMDISFRLGPRINAAGRLDSATRALELLLCKDPLIAKNISEDLEKNNKQRQEIESLVSLEAIQMVESDNTGKYNFGAVVGNKGWHPGVVGIVASRLSRKIYRPVFVVAIDAEGMGKGSGRSIDGVSLVKFIEDNQEVLESGGGHDMAAGITIKEQELDALNEELQGFVSRQVDSSLLMPKLHLDTTCELKEINIELLDYYQKLEPFGLSNAEPILLAKGLHATAEPKILKQKHLRMTLRQGEAICDAIYFSGAEVSLPRPPWDVAFSILRNDFRGNISIQMNVKAIRSSSATI